MRIQHNISAMNSKRNLNKNSSALAKNLEKLASGFRINRAADDAAGLAISEMMRLSIAGFEQGEHNVADGISLAQTADGALHEVQALLDRMITLSTQASNGTLDTEDRQHIQKEIDEILKEITRIRNDTEFNGIPLFKGFDEIRVDGDGNPTANGDIPFEDISLLDTVLSTNPFQNNASADNLALQAIVVNPDSSVVGSRFNMIYGNGSTSDASLRLEYNGQTVDVDFDALTYEGTSGAIDDPANPLCRTYTYSNADGVEIQIDQKIHVTENDNEKFYNITYDFTNLGDVDVDAKFMFHVDTAYNNNDRCEGYYVDGTKIAQTGTYVGQDALPGVSANPTPPSFSIINEDQALAFSEKVEFDPANLPDLSIGNYSQVREWSHYPTAGGQTTNNMDLGFSLAWKFDSFSAADPDPAVDPDTRSVSFKFGIVRATEDPNLDNVDLTPDKTYVADHTEKQQIWIQGSAESGDSGMWMSIGEISLNLLGIAGTSVTTVENAVRSIGQAKSAKNYVNEILGQIGADQNRLEHMQQSNGVTKENLAQSESVIRDTNIADEMMAYTKNNILIQSAQAMLAQSNMVPQGVLQLMK